MATEARTPLCGVAGNSMNCLAVPPGTPSGDGSYRIKIKVAEGANLISILNQVQGDNIVYPQQKLITS
ncbi:MAG: hypothetical protein ACE5KZ_02260 [Candidatus Scalinduaceae bacterium]